MFAEGEALWEALAERHRGDPRAHLLAWVREKADYVLTDCRGCTLANAAVEITEPGHPARRYIEERKAAYRLRLTALCAAAGAAPGRAPGRRADRCCSRARASAARAAAWTDPHAKFMRIAEAMIAAFAGA